MSDLIVKLPCMWENSIFIYYKEDIILQTILPLQYNSSLLLVEAPRCDLRIPTL